MFQSDHNLIQHSQRGRRFMFVLVLVFAIGVVAGCRPQNSFRGKGYTVLIPPGWKKGDPINKNFYRLSNYKPELVTFVSPERRSKFDDPEATISIYTQKFDDPIWVEDITHKILGWVRKQGYEILGEGKITYEGDVGYSINYREKYNDNSYLDFYFTTDGRVFLVVTYATTLKNFKKYIPDFEFFRNSIEFTLGVF